MALYNHGNRLAQSQDAAFDVMHASGMDAPNPRIYRCASCGDEIAIDGGHTLPPQSHRQHNPANGQSRWQLLAYSVQQR